MPIVSLRNNLDLFPQVTQIVSTYLKRHELSGIALEDFCAALQRVAEGAPSVAGDAPKSFSSTQSPIASESIDHSSMNTISDAAAVTGEAPHKPAVPIEDSVQPDFIICLEDGARVTLLKRYLQSQFALTPAAYRAKWNLSADYPMTAPNYSKKRSELARAMGLGRVAEPAPALEQLEPAAAGPAPEATEPAALPAPLADETPPISEQPPMPQKSRPILRLAAWQKAAEPKIDADAAVQPPEEPVIEAPKLAEPAAKPEEAAPASGGRGFRYPVNRYSR